MSPSYSRHSGYDSLADENNGYKFECSQCEQKVFFPFAMLIGKEWSWENSYEKNVVVQIRDHFKMNIVGKTPDGGWPVISELTCQN